MENQQDCQQQRDRRPDALGNLRVLADELLCSIIDRLDPRDVGRLACASSVLYILCNEEPLWMNLCLKFAGPLVYKSSWKKTTLHRQNLATQVPETIGKPLTFDGFNSLYLYRRWYRRFTTLEAFSVDNGDLERKEDVSLEEFYANYDGQKPVLFTDLANTWPARNTWTIDQLLKKYGETAFRISQKSSKKISMKFKDYVSYMSHQHDEDPLYVFDDKFGEAAPSLLKDYSVPTLFQEDFFDVLDEERRPPFRWLIIGPERSGASWHVDPGLTSAWNTLIVGCKRWALYPPGKVPAGITVHVNEVDGDVYVESPSSLQWWLDIYPFLQEVDKPLECTQLPGETIFVPSGWWHCVLNLETTVAVTQNFVNTSNFLFVCLDMSPGHLHKGVSRAGWLAAHGKSVNYVIENTSIVDQQNYLDMARKEKRLRLLSSVDDQNEDSRVKKCKSNIYEDDHEKEFIYDVNFLSKFLENENDHYNSIWSSGNFIEQRVFREWLNKLWVVKPEIRPLVWKGACLSIKADQWLACATVICASHNLPFPLEHERLPVGMGSNPVFLASDYVVKIYIEGGLEPSLYSLSTELEFYSLLQKFQSSLIKHVPEICASGIIFHDSVSYKNYAWDGKGVPEIITNLDLVDRHCLNDDFCFGVWGKMKYELQNGTTRPSSGLFPYLITKRCNGQIFANLRERLSIVEKSILASFLGEQLHSLHVLPLPHLKSDILMDTKSFCFSSEWSFSVGAIEKRINGLSCRLAQWGDPIPKALISKVEEYIPSNIQLLYSAFKGDNGFSNASQMPSWIHSDIMDDNINMAQYCADHCQTVTNAHLTSNDNGSLNKENMKKWYPAYILDFGDLSIGDPICDLIPIHIDVFRGDSNLLKLLLENYKLPLGKVSGGTVSSWTKFEKASYRAMCYCIFHKENVLGAIFSLREDLKRATCWEEVEEALWSVLNEYQRMQNR